MFVRRSTKDRELMLLRLELMIASRDPGVIPSAEALQGLRRQLLMALPDKRSHPVRRRLWARKAGDAYDRMVSLFMAAYEGQPGIGEFEVFRRAVVEAAGTRRSRLDVLAEVHEWLVRDRDWDGVVSQLEDRLAQQGVGIVRKPSVDHQADQRFRCHGNGALLSVVSPAYTIDVEGREVVVRQGNLDCAPEAVHEDEPDSAGESPPGIGQSDGGPGMGGDSVDDTDVEPEDVYSTDRPVDDDQSVANGAESEIREGDQSADGKFDETEIHTEDGERNE